MSTRHASAIWEGNLIEGHGKMKLGSGAYEGPYTFKSRFEDGDGTNPEELIGAAHAGCFSMALSHGIAEAGFKPKSVKTSAEVTLAKAADGFRIESIHLTCKAEIPGLDETKFKEYAEGAKKGCPVSKALTGVKITLDAKLI
jgi:osmotically inducible protein OsmC